MAQLLIERVKISSLTADPKNARRHPQLNLEAITRSLKTFGQQKPLVVDADGVVVAGNGTLAAASALGWDEIDVVRTDLRGAAARAYALADNKAGDLAGWDEEKLAAALAEVACNEDLDALATGFSEAEIQRAVDALTPPNDGADDAVEPPAEAVTKAGDLWILGDHRLLCGDSTKAEDVARLMNVEKAGLMNTDPPYGVDYCAVKNGIPRNGFRDIQKKQGDIENDDLTKGPELQRFLEDVIRAALPHLSGAPAFYLWHPMLTQGTFFAAAAAADILIHRQIIWVKPGFVLTRSGQYHWRHELCFYGWIRGKQCPWYGDKSQTSVWEIAQPKDEGERVHMTQKPCALFETPILNHTRKGEVVYEPFSGSGSQIIAAEKTKRRCYAMEISPRFVDVAVARWEKFTGRKATRDGTSRTSKNTDTDSQDARERPGRGAGAIADQVGHAQAADAGDPHDGGGAQGVAPAVPADAGYGGARATGRKRAGAVRAHADAVAQGGGVPSRTRRGILTEARGRNGGVRALPAGTDLRQPGARAPATRAALRADTVGTFVAARGSKRKTGKKARARK